MRRECSRHVPAAIPKLPRLSQRVLQPLLPRMFLRTRFQLPPLRRPQHPRSQLPPLPEVRFQLPLEETTSEIPAAPAPGGEVPVAPAQETTSEIPAAPTEEASTVPGRTEVPGFTEIPGPTEVAPPSKVPPPAAEAVEDDVEVTGFKITKKSKKKNKGVKRLLWLQENIQRLKDEGRWHGDDAPNPAHKRARLQAEQGK